jgi:hypothetical protein
MLGLTGCSDSFRKTLNVIEHGILFEAFLRVYVWISQETIGRMTYFALDFLLRNYQLASIFPSRGLTTLVQHHTA